MHYMQSSQGKRFHMYAPGHYSLGGEEVSHVYMRRGIIYWGGGKRFHMYAPGHYIGGERGFTCMHRGTIYWGGEEVSHVCTGALYIGGGKRFHMYAPGHTQKSLGGVENKKRQRHHPFF